jgi:hypothetical protein
MKLGSVRRWIEESIDIDHYDLMYTMQLFMSGNKEAIQEAMEGKILSKSSSDRRGRELPNYADLEPGIGEVGLQNHLLVNGRINVQGLTLEPDIVFQSDDPLMREFNTNLFAQLAQQQRWSDHWYMAGMEVEANGMASARCGVARGDRPDWRHTPNLDTLWDRGKKAPSHWRWVADRDRLSPEECEEIYGDALDAEDIEMLTGKEHLPDGSKRTAAKQIIEWQWYAEDYHLVFLGSIFGSDSIVLQWTDDGYRRLGRRGMTIEEQKDLDCGPNPYGMIPKAVWTDSWAPGVKRAVAKSETTLRLAQMLNEVELFLVTCLREGAPITSIDTSKIMADQDLLDEIKDCKSVKSLQKLIMVNGGTVADMMSRTPAMAIPEVAMYLRGMLKEEINAATGTSDMQRGQALGGERRTRFEVEKLVDQSGIQARHFRRSFARFLEDVVQITRAMGAMYLKARIKVPLQSYPSIYCTEAPLDELLGTDLPCQVNPNSLIFRTEEEIKEAALGEFQAWHLPMIQAGAMSAKKSLRVIGKRMGYKDPEAELGVTPEEQMALAGMVPGAPPGALPVGPSAGVSAGV